MSHDNIRIDNLAHWQVVLPQQQQLLARESNQRRQHALHVLEILYHQHGIPLDSAPQHTVPVAHESSPRKLIGPPRASLRASGHHTKGKVFLGPSSWDEQGDSKGHRVEPR